jgi:hypothetical protein
LPNNQDSSYLTCPLEQAMADTTTPATPTLAPYGSGATGEIRLPVIFIGDLHGNVQFLNALQRRFPDHFKIFVGDFVDSRTAASRNDELSCLDTVLNLIEQGKARACFGNHEWSYLEPAIRCSNYTAEFDQQLKPYKDRMKRFLEFFVWLPDQKILVTHAGITLKLWNECGFTVKTAAAKLAEWSMLPVMDSPASWIGMSRGGMDPIGGIFWCDYYTEFEPVPGLIQIFGHTSALTGGKVAKDQAQGIRKRGNSYNIDCLVRTWEVLELQPDGILRTLIIPK